MSYYIFSGFTVFSSFLDSFIFVYPDFLLLFRSILYSLLYDHGFFLEDYALSQYRLSQLEDSLSAEFSVSSNDFVRVCIHGWKIYNLQDFENDSWEPEQRRTLESRIKDDPEPSDQSQERNLIGVIELENSKL